MPTSAPGRRSGWLWLIAGMAFLLGALLGVAITVTVHDHTGPIAAGSGTASPSTSPSTAPTLIPPDCQRALDRAMAALSTAEAAADALRHLQTARLQRLLADLETMRREAEVLTARCHQETRPGG